MNRRTPVALLAAGVLALGLALPAGAEPEPSNNTPSTTPSRSASATGATPPAVGGPRQGVAVQQRGHEGVCTDYKGVSVVVDFQELGGTTVRRCALPKGGQSRFDGTGVDALSAAGVDLEGVDRWGLAFICRLQNTPSATQTLTVAGQPYKEACKDTPPAAAYWSYWHTPSKKGPWTYSQLGAGNRKATNGGYEGWSFSLNKSASTNPEPRVTPAAAPPSAPRPFSAATPKVTGTAKVGSTLKVSKGTWSPGPTKFSYRWYRDGVAISGSWYDTYKVKSTDAGRNLTVKVTGSGSGRATTWSTTTTTKVAGAAAASEPTPEHAPEPTDPPATGATGSSSEAADWLHGELGDDGLMPGFSPGTPDVGLTIDAFWGLMAADPSDPRLKTMWTDISAKAMDYAGTDWVNIGGSAKVLLAAETAGAGHELTTSGGAKVDLRQRLLESVDADGELTGRQNTFVQSLAVMALVRSGAAESDKATVQRTVDALARRQCSDGWFVMPDVPADSTCDEEVAGGGWGQDNDATSLALMAFSSADDAGLTVPADATDKALDSLEETQDGEGGIGGGGPTAAANSNSTGLAAAVLDDGDRSEAAADARSWVADVQVDGDTGGDLADELGAIAYDPDSFDEARSGGISGRDQWRRASAQAVLALAPAVYGDLGAAGEDPPFTTSPNPTIAGRARVGTTLIAYQGGWQPKPTRASLRWLRDGEPIAAYGNRYTVTARDAGHRISVRTTAVSSDGSTVQRVSDPTASVAKGVFTAPTPTVAGSPKVGATLTAYRGAWSPSPSRASFRWMRDGTPMAYYGNRYTLSSRDRGHRVSVRVTGSRAGYATRSIESTRDGVK